MCEWSRGDEGEDRGGELGLGLGGGGRYGVGGGEWAGALTPLDLRPGCVGDEL